MNPTLGVVLAVVAALGGLTGITALVFVVPTYRKMNSEARKAGAEASEVVAKGAVVLLLPLHEEIIALRAQVDELKVTLALERTASQEERAVTQETIGGLRGEIARKDRRIIEFEQHLMECNSLAADGTQ